MDRPDGPARPDGLDRPDGKLVHLVNLVNPILKFLDFWCISDCQKSRKIAISKAPPFDFVPHPGNSGEIWRNQRGGPLKLQFYEVSGSRLCTKNPEISKSGLVGLVGLVGLASLVGLGGFRRVGRVKKDPTDRPTGRSDSSWGRWP